MTLPLSMTNVLIFDIAKSYSNCYHLKKNDAISYDLLTYENQNFTVTLICNHVSQSKSESGSKKYNTSPTYKTVTYYVNAQFFFFFLNTPPTFSDHLPQHLLLPEIFINSPPSKSKISTQNWKRFSFVF